jgi:steroid delta-isomerase-like uncharacterized protein
MSQSPGQVVEAWSLAFNRQDADALAALYAERAVNWQVNEQPLEGREAIRESFRSLFRAFPDMGHAIVNLLEEGEWAALEWDGWGTHRGEFAGHPPSGRAYRMRGCGFFQVCDGLIVFQRGYWDRLTWLSQIGLSC